MKVLGPIYYELHQRMNQPIPLKRGSRLPSMTHVICSTVSSTIYAITCYTHGDFTCLSILTEKRTDLERLASPPGFVGEAVMNFRHQAIDIP